MPGPAIPVTAAAINLVTRLAAKEGIKLTAKQASAIAARNPQVMQMAGMNRSKLGLVMSNPHMKAMLAGLGSIPVGTTALLYNMTKEDEEPVVEEEGIETLTEKDNNFAGGGMVRRRVPDVYFQRYKDGGEAKSFPDLNNDGEITQADILKGRGVEFRDGGAVGSETHEEKIMRMERELMRMLNEGDTEMSNMFDDFNNPDAQTYNQTIIEKNPEAEIEEFFDGSDTTYGDDAFARQLLELEKRKKMEEALSKLEPGQRLAHGGAVRGYNMGGAVMPQQRPQGIATMMTDPRTNMGNMPNQQQQQLAALQTTANAANLNANNLQKSMQAQQQQAMRGSVTAPISQVRIPSTKRRQFEDTLLNSRRRGQRAGQMAQRRASIPATIFG